MKKATPCEAHGLTPKKHCVELEKMLREVPGDFCMHEGDGAPHEAVRRFASAYEEACEERDEAIAVLQRIAKQDAWKGVDGAPWKHWSAIANEFLGTDSATKVRGGT